MEVINLVVVIFSLLGALDRVTGGRFGLGIEFEKGFRLLGNLVLSMVGMIVITPFLASALEPVFTIIWKYLHVDPSVVPAMLFANDMGGAPLATQIAINEQIGGFNALIVSAMMGVTISFTIPYALELVPVRQQKELFLGILCGIVTIPIGCMASGVMLGVPFTQLLVNLIPLLIFSGLLIYGILRHPELCVKLFRGLAVIIRGIITVGLMLGIIQFMLGKTVISPLSTLEDGIMICLNACVVLSGAFAFMHILSKLLDKPLCKFGDKMGINNISALGFTSSLVASASMFGIMDEMDEKGVVLNSAFAVSASNVLGAHLAFTMAFNAEYVPAVIVGKLIAGILAVFIANNVYNRNRS